MSRALVIALVGCSNESTELRDGEQRHSMKVGDEWRVELKSNAKTGFQWLIQPGPALDWRAVRGRARFPRQIQ